MPPRITPKPVSLRAVSRASTPKSIPRVILSPLQTHAYSTAAAIAPALGTLKLPDDYVPPTQPPSYKPADVRKSQVIRSYTSLLRTSPLILLFQHNNLTGEEFTAVRRELTAALRAVPQGPNDAFNISDFVRLQVLATRLFRMALKITEFHDPAAARKKGEQYVHDLSKAARKSVEKAEKKGWGEGRSTYAALEPLFVGPVAALTIPVVSPAHLAACLSILAPRAPLFPAPTRRKRPDYHEPIVQSGLHKLLLIGGLVEGKVMDEEMVRWVGGIEGGLDSLRAQLVGMLQAAGLGVTTALEGSGKSLWLALESRRSVLEEEEKGEKKEEK